MEEDLFVYVVVGPLLVLPPPVVQLGLSLGSVCLVWLLHKSCNFTQTSTTPFLQTRRTVAVIEMGPGERIRMSNSVGYFLTYCVGFCASARVSLCMQSLIKAVRSPAHNIRAWKIFYYSLIVCALLCCNPWCVALLDSPRKWADRGYLAINSGLSTNEQYERDER